jgi:hypothetical protein
MGWHVLPDASIEFGPRTEEEGGEEGADERDARRVLPDQGLRPRQLLDLGAREARVAAGARHGRHRRRPANGRLDGIALRLRRGVRPDGAVRQREAVVEVDGQRVLRLHLAQRLQPVGVPKDGPVLLRAPRDRTHAREQGLVLPAEELVEACMKARRV